MAARDQSAKRLIDHRASAEVAQVKGLLSAKFPGTSTFKPITGGLSSLLAAVRGTVNGRKPRTRREGEYETHSFANPTTNPEHPRPENYVIAAEEFGVPQKRHRLILLGVPSGLTVPGGETLRPSPAPTVGDVPADLPLVRCQLSHQKNS